jgi:hypothetical protein
MKKKKKKKGQIDKLQFLPYLLGEVHFSSSIKVSNVSTPLSKGWKIDCIPKILLEIDRNMLVF